MKKSFLFSAILVIACIPFAFAGQGEGPGPGGPGGPNNHDGPEIGGPPEMIIEKGFGKSLEDLKLTEDQQEKLREIRDSSKRDIFNLKHEIQLAVMDIQDEYKKEKSDSAKISGYIDKLSDAQKKLMKIRSDQMLKMKAVLTPEQFKKLIKKIDKSKDRVKKSFFDKLRGK
jgi:Spy/CpxP family protein refolding chaperone